MLPKEVDSKLVGNIDIELEIVKGVVETVRLRYDQDIEDAQDFVDSIQGVEFGPKLWDAVHRRLAGSKFRQFFTDCVYTMSHKFA